jgi:hypothetical protein
MCESSDGSQPFAAAYTLVYLSIRGGNCFAFPCDEAGTVEMNTLGDRARDDYLLARALVGRDFHSPTVVCRPTGPAAAQGRPPGSP